MTDRVDKRTRSRIMSANRAKNTSPEVEVQQALHARGFRFDAHVGELVGRPDIVLPKHRVLIFVHGCFWHGHRCTRSPRSKTNVMFWTKKIRQNRIRDLKVRNALLNAGWRVAVVWECSVRRQKPVFAKGDLIRLLAKWIRGHGRLAVMTQSGMEECL